MDIAWAKILQSAAPFLLKKLQPTDRDKAIRKSIELFIEVFTAELQATSPLTAVTEAHLAELKQFIEGKASHEIAAHMHPEPRTIDPAPFRRMWEGMNLSPLPEDFDWSLIAKNFERAIRRHIKDDPTLREALNTVLLERAAGPDPGFDLPGYRRYLTTKCGAVQLGPIHSSAYDRRLALWSVFVPQEARESTPGLDLPRELRLRLRAEGHDIQDQPAAGELEELRQRYQSSAIRPVLEILARERLTVILGDPGSGKTSLLKYLAMRWVNEDGPILPIWIDLREYAQQPHGFLKFCDSHHTHYGLNFSALDQRLQDGTAALYLDGLDEIFDLATRSAVIEAAAAFAARYTRAPVVVTSRIIGYDPERLTNAGFRHATLEDFDDSRVHEFLTNWYEAAEADPAERTRLINRIAQALRESRAIRDLAGNPLLLTMMAILNANQELPRDRVELYREASRVLLQDWDASKTLPKDIFARQEKEELLRELAGAMQQEEGGLAGNLISRKRLHEVFRTYIQGLGINDVYEKANKLIEQLTTRNFILCHYGANHFGFVHRTFLEYFCATWFHDKEPTIDELKQLYAEHWQDEKWHEVLRLIAGMEKPGKAEALIQFLMEQDGREDKYENMMLAAGCLSEVRKRHEIQQTDAALLDKFQTQVIRWEPPYYFEDYQEYQECGPTREKAMHWVAYTWRSEETRRWFKRTTSTDPNWIVRYAAVQELARGWKDHPDTRPWLLDRARNDEHEWVRRAAVHKLAQGWNDHPATLPLLLDRARNDGDNAVRRAAVQELARGWKDHPDTRPLLLDRARNDGDSDVRRAAIQELARGWPNHPDIITLKAELGIT